MLSHQVLTNLLILTLSTKGSVSITILTNNKNLLFLPKDQYLLPYLLITKTYWPKAYYYHTY